MCIRDRYISLGSIIAAAALPILTAFSPIRNDVGRIPLTVMTLLIGIFVIWRHRTNITRLINGTENKFKLK